MSVSFAKLTDVMNFSLVVLVVLMGVFCEIFCILIYHSFRNL